MQTAVEVATDTQAQSVSVQVHLIDPGRNPRNRITTAALEQLESSIRAQGLLQPILLRRVGERYKIVAGNRRFLCYTAIHGSEAGVVIPALVKDMDDAQAEQNALTENVIREKMSEVDEAESAARVLGDCQGNRDEAAARLGWKRPFLDRRLALMNAIAEVRAALQEEKIFLGHAELLAGLRKETQAQILTGLLGMAELPTVLQLKDRLEKAALPLMSAIFNKDGCVDCQHNSGNQTVLFSEAISGGNCTNKPCFEQKTEAELTLRAKALETDYQVVRIIRPGDNFTIVKLVAEGARGVGAEQAQACRTCKDFGAVVSALPDKLGDAYKAMCMNTECNTGKIAERIMAEKAAAAVGAEEVIARAKAGTATAGKTASDTATGPEKPAPKAAKVPAVVKAQASSLPSNALKVYREKVWRVVLNRAIAKLDNETNLCVLLALAAFSPRMIDSSKLSTALAKSSIALDHSLADIGAVLESALALESDALKKAIGLIAVSISSEMEIRQVVSLLKGLDVKLEQYWQVNEEFFDLLTKNEIDATCGEIGVKQAIGAAYAKLVGGKKGDLVKAVLSAPGFEYKGQIPKQLRW